MPSVLASFDVFHSILLCSPTEARALELGCRSGYCWSPPINSPIMDRSTDLYQVRSTSLTRKLLIQYDIRCREKGISCQQSVANTDGSISLISVLNFAPTSLATMLVLWRVHICGGGRNNTWIEVIARRKATAVNKIVGWVNVYIYRRQMLCMGDKCGTRRVKSQSKATHCIAREKSNGILYPC